MFFSDISRFAIQTFVGGWYRGVVTKIEFKTKEHIINMIGELTHEGTKNNDLALVDQTTDHFSNGYRLARKFWGSLFLRIGDFLWFAGTNFCD